MKSAADVSFSRDLLYKFLLKRFLVCQFFFFLIKKFGSIQVLLEGIIHSAHQRCFPWLKTRMGIHRLSQQHYYYTY